MSTQYHAGAPGVLEFAKQVLALASSGEKPAWVNCETRGPWVRNGLKARIDELRKSEKRVRAAYTKPFMAEPCAFIADAYAEAAAVFERRLAATQADQPLKGK